MRAIITGITGQDGAYLAKLLLAKGYQVLGGHRRSSERNFWRLKELGIYDHKRLLLSDLEVTDYSSVKSIIENFHPTEIYNLAAQSFVAASFDQPLNTTRINGEGPLNILEVIKNTDRKIKFYQASTSEMFGKVQSIPQDEKTAFYPRSPYGVAKLFGHWITVNYREAYGIHAVSGILFNHESPLRGEEFVTRKITTSVAKIKLRKQKTLELGNLSAKRDWGHAEDYVDGMWRMLQHNKALDFVLATNKTHTVREFVEKTFNAAEIEIHWEGQGVNERGFNTKTGEIVVTVSERFFRPAEVEILQGSYKKANDLLKWSPRKTLDDICEEMLKSDLTRSVP